MVSFAIHARPLKILSQHETNCKNPAIGECQTAESEVNTTET